MDNVQSTNALKKLGTPVVWDAPHPVVAHMTQRIGGVSTAPFDSLNVGDHVGDDPRAVLANRSLLTQALGLTPCFMTQVHGTHVHLLTQANATLSVEADAVVCATPGLAAAIMVADCLPVLFAHKHKPLVAGAHAGWRGLANGVLQATVQAMAAQAQCSVGELCRDVHVWLGPCIGPAAFEVGAEVRAAFVAQHPQAHACFELVEPTQPQLFGDVACGIRAAAGLGSVRANKYLANLPALAQLVLSELGIVSVTGNDASPAWCTAGNPDVYFSYRRDQPALGGSGRMAAFIGLQAC